MYIENIANFVTGKINYNDKFLSVRRCGNSLCQNSIKNDHKYCSSKCYNINKKYINKITPGKKICLNDCCSKPFKSNKSTTKFCSHKCFETHKKATNIKLGLGKPLYICQNPECGKGFKRKGAAISKFCSHPCYLIVRKSITNHNSGTFKPGQKPANYAEIGTVKLRRSNNRTKAIRRFTKTENGWELTSNVTWTFHNGKIPDNHIIDFIDGEHFNDQDINNLILKTK